MSNRDTEKLISRISVDMRLAIKSGDTFAVNELRALLARISNAEALPIQEGIEGVEAQRRLLTLQDIMSILADEENEILNTISVIDADSEYAVVLNKKLDVIRRYK